MKKFSLVILAALLLVCYGCSAADGKTNVSNPDEAVVTISGRDYTRGTFYQGMLSSNGSSLIMQKLVSMMYASKISEDESEIIKAAEEDANELIELAGDYLDFYLYYYAGVSTIEQYKEVMIYYNKLDALADKYIEDNFDGISAENPAKQVRIIEFTSIDVANEALAELKGGADFATVSTEKGTANYGTDPYVIVSKATSYDANLLAAVNEAAANGYLEVITSSSATSFYVVEVVSSDIATFHADYVDALINEGVITEDTFLPAYAKEGNFQIYDEDLYNQFKTDYPAFFE